MTVDPPQAESGQAGSDHTDPVESEAAPYNPLDAGRLATDGATAAPKRPAIKIGSQRDEPNSPPLPPAGVSELAQAADAETLTAGDPIADSSSPPGAVVADESESYFPTPLAKRTSSDLEGEIAAALGDRSLDELIAAEDSPTQGASLEPDTRLQGKVVKIHREDVFFALGGRDEGVAPLKQFADPPAIDSTLEVIVVSHNVNESLYELSIPGATVHVGDWSDISDGMVVEAHVTGHNSGGLECDVNKLPGFIPASQISLFRVDDMEQYVDQRLQCVVVESNMQRRNLILSHRGVLEREKEAARQKLLGELEVGQVREGVVRKLQDFGAFVDLGGVDGLVHISRLSWDRVDHPSDVLKEGQPIKVKVEKIDPTTGKIGLSYRDTTVHPWENVEAKYFVGATVTGTVSRVAKFGAFVRLEPGVEGLIHISELSHHRVQRVTSVVKEKQEVEVKVLSLDREAQRMSLSLKAMMSEPAEESDEAPDEVSGPSVPHFKGELKGGTNRLSGGDQFGLKW